jgi:aryl-alcohol dehydrogenase-like predicted oxidoreductase
VEYRQLGNTGLEISEIGFGCGPTAGLITHGSREDRRNVVARALDLGVTLFDTASVYGSGQSESNLGETFKDLGVRPLVGTKICLEIDDLVGDIAGAVVRMAEESLGRLGLDSVELIQMHNRVGAERAGMARWGESQTGVGALLTLDDVIGSRGVAEGFDILKRDGKARFSGFTAFGGEPVLIHQMIDSGRFDSLNVLYNILNPTAARSAPAGFQDYDYGQVIPRAAGRGMGVIILQALASGLLSGTAVRVPISAISGKDLSGSSDAERAQALRYLEVGGRQSMVQAAIKFVLMNENVSTCLIGISAMEHLEEAASSSGKGRLSAPDMARIEELYTTDFGRKNAVD